MPHAGSLQMCAHCRANCSSSAQSHPAHAAIYICRGELFRERAALCHTVDSNALASPDYLSAITGLGSKLLISLPPTPIPPLSSEGWFVLRGDHQAINSRTELAFCVEDEAHDHITLALPLHYPCFSQCFQEAITSNTSHGNDKVPVVPSLWRRSPAEYHI